MAFISSISFFDSDRPFVSVIPPIDGSGMYFFVVIFGFMVDLVKMQNKIDALFEKETPRTFRKWHRNHLNKHKKLRICKRLRH